MRGLTLYGSCAWQAPVAPEDNADERGGGQQAKERRVNKFAGNADDDTPEEDANLVGPCGYCY